jgi:gamma-glutamyltranspeptidase/glutathione hydrolase
MLRLCLLTLCAAIAVIRPTIAAAETYERGVVAADHPLASEAGAEMLRKGGNVVDAAVATAFALSVVRPESCGLGGGGFMVIWDASARRAVAIDYRERAPRQSHRDMFVKHGGPAPAGASSVEGGLAVAVPGDVAGLCLALEAYGTLDRKTVLSPALRLARDGFTVDQTFVASQAEVLRDFAADTGRAQQHAALFRQYLNGGRQPAVGDRFQSPLADVLQRIADEGPAGFYRGPVAEAIVAAVRAQGGVITHEDLRDTTAVVREPLTGQYAGYDIVTMPPPSSGGVALLETLGILAAWERSHPNQSLLQLGHNRPAMVQLITEALKHAFADRAAFLGDGDFVDVPVGTLLDRGRAERLAATLSLERTQPAEAYGRFAPREDHGTSHLCVIDAAGNAVACTETINTTYGSYVVVPEFGIVLNNQMDDFAAIPGQPNAFGLLQGEANAVAPGKKPLSSMTPTILVQDGRAVLVLGASGGPRIISSTLQVLLNVVRFGMIPEAAVEAPRFHHQWLPEELLLEPRLAAEVAEQMERRGHVTRVRAELSVTQAAGRSANGVRGASDSRKGGRPAGH